jgi:hypothetical protein
VRLSTGFQAPSTTQREDREGLESAREKSNNQKWFYPALVAALRPRRTNESHGKLYKEFKRKVREVFNELQKGGKA